MMQTRTVPVVVSVVGLAAMLAGCTGSPDAGASSNATSPITASSAPNLDEFCELGLELLEPVPRPFIGTDDHVARFTALLEVASEDLVDTIALLEAHYDTSVDPDDPDSQNFDSFPAPVQDGALYLTDEINARCDAPE